MGGRVYDPNLGRFLSADPIIQDPANSQAINPYSYVLNNPFGGTDPSGYSTVDTRSICFRSPGCGRIFRTDSVTALNQLAARSNGAERQWLAIRNTYDDLRVAIEDGIEDPILNEIVVRFRDNISVGRLNGVMVVQNAELREVQRLAISAAEVRAHPPRRGPAACDNAANRTVAGHQHGNALFHEIRKRRG